MSHFLTLVITPNVPTENEKLKLIEDLIEPYRETETFARIKYKKSDMASYRKLAIEEYNKKLNLPSVYRTEYILDRINVLTEMSDEEYWESLLDEGDEDVYGNITTRYNEHSKFDWYVIGGRWSDEIPNDECNVKELITNPVYPYAILGPNGSWYEKGVMGWFGMSDDNHTEEEWTDICNMIYKTYGDGRFTATAIDMHI